MNKRKQAYLFKRFAQFFPTEFDPSKTLMGFGFCIGNGWYKLITDLLLDLEKLAVKYPDKFKSFEIIQVKEKLGGLRVYTNFIPDLGPADTVGEVISRTEFMSFDICEDCGKIGKLRVEDRTWIRTLCDKCNQTDLIKTAKKSRFSRLILEELAKTSSE